MLFVRPLQSDGGSAVGHCYLYFYVLLSCLSAHFLYTVYVVQGVVGRTNHTFLFVPMYMIVNALNTFAGFGDQRCESSMNVLLKLPAPGFCHVGIRRLSEDVVVCVCVWRGKDGLQICN